LTHPSLEEVNENSAWGCAKREKGISNKKRVKCRLLFFMGVECVV